MGAHIVNKIIAGLSAILSLVLIGICIWTLTSLMVHENGSSKEAKNCSVHNNEHRKNLCNSSSSHNDHELQHQPFEDEHINEDKYVDAVVIEARKDVWAEFSEMRETFRLILLVCLPLTIAASLAQLISSFVLICSTPTKVASRSRKIVGLLFATFVIFIVCLTLTVCVKRDADVEGQDGLHTMTSLNGMINNFFESLDSWKRLQHDLTAYYIVVFANILFLFFHMVVTCCLLRCSGDEEYYVS